MLELLLVSFDTPKSTFLTNFCNPEIPVLGRCQSRDWRKRPGSRDSGSRDCKH